VWAPLHHPVFRALWIAGLVSDFGAWMHELANETGEPEVRHLIAVTEEDGDDSS
jgi:hypothetical protein